MESFLYEDLKSKILKIIENNEETNAIDELELLIKPINLDKSLDLDIKSCVDYSFKKILLNCSKQNVKIEVYESFIDLSIDAARRDLCTGNLPIILLTDLFEYNTTNECEKLFDLIEKRIEIWKEEFFFKSVKNQLLRTCNDLLRRLSRSQNTVFCGRILVFLANFFPFFERSGLNLISEFNHDESMQVMFEEENNLKNNSAENGISLDSNSSLALEEEEGLISSNENINLDFDLYKKFWSLQEYYRIPVLCYKPLHWKKFKECANETIELFSNFKIDNSNCINSNNLNENLEKDYFPKYLTSQKLLELQLCDSNFRRNILIQFLILFQYLIGKIKFKSEQQVLNEDQFNWVKETTEKVLKLLSKTPPNGEKIKNSITQILTREEFWSNWKNEACTELKKCNEPSKRNLSEPPLKKMNLGEKIKNAESKNEILIGSEELTQIWNLNQNNWNACKTKNRVFVPSIEEFFADVLTKEGLEYKHFFTEEPNFCWRSLRLLSRQCSSFFTHSSTCVKPVKEYIENIIDKLSNERNLDKKINSKSNNENSEDIIYNLK